VIAVIDDDASVRRALVRLFRTVGLEVAQFATAEDYLAGTARDVDCLVIDVNLPGISGLELLEKLRGETQKPALVITAQGDEQARNRAVALGAAGFFPKPCDNRELLATVVRALGLSGPEGTEVAGPGSS
jgi:FixJ family two-component response regulator